MKEELTPAFSETQTRPAQSTSATRAGARPAPTRIVPERGGSDAPVPAKAPLGTALGVWLRLASPRHSLGIRRGRLLLSLGG